MANEKTVKNNSFRVFGTSENAYLLNEIGLEGITMLVADSKYTRKVCACGAVLPEDRTECSCGNKDFVAVSHSNRWSRYSQPIFIKSKGFELVETPSKVEVIEKYIMVTETAAKTIKFEERKNTVVMVDLNTFELMRRESCSISNELDATTFLREEIKNISDKAIKAALEEAYHVRDMLFNHDREVSLAFKLMSYPSTMYILTDENMEKYKVFFQKAFNRNNWNTDYLAGKLCKNMEDFWRALSLPVDFETYYRSTEFTFGGYYYYSSNTNISEENLHKLPIELQRTLKYSLEHHTISLQEISSIVEWGVTKTEEECIILAKYIKKHGMQYQENTFRRFQDMYSMAISNGYKLEDIVNPKKMSLLEAISLLKKRGFADSRIDGFCDIFDKDPAYAIEMLSSKARIKPNESEYIGNKLL